MSVSQNELRFAFPGKGFSDLLSSPVSTGILRQIEMEDLSITMTKNNEYVEYAISNRGHSEEIYGSYLAGMIL